jgi:hypothetical protein
MSGVIPNNAIFYDPEVQLSEYLISAGEEVLGPIDRFQKVADQLPQPSLIASISNETVVEATIDKVNKLDIERAKAIALLLCLEAVEIFRLFSMGSK